MRKKRYRYMIFCICLFLGLSLFLSSCGKKDEVQFFPAEKHVEMNEADDPAETEKTEQIRTIFVDVDGAVKQPGVYEVPDGSRVFQAVEAAGGVLESAVCRNVNLAAILKDEQYVYIPFPDEQEDDMNCPDESSMTQGKININQADLEQFRTLPGIGETRAKEILKYREEHGGFSSIEEIMNVQGIKEGTFAKIKDEIVVG